MESAQELVRDSGLLARIVESESRFHALFDQVTAGITETDLQGRFVLVNPRYCQMLGYARDELLAMRMQDITHPDDLPRNLELFRGLLDGGAPFVIEKRYIRKDGSILWVNNSVTIIRDAQGRPRHICAVCVDISERRATEEALRQSEERHRRLVAECQNAEAELHRAKEAAEAANKAKDQFLAVLSHELRTPLTPVLAIVSALEQQADLPKPVRADLQVIRRNVELETRLIDDLLDLTRITKGKLQLHMEAVDLREAVNRVVEICRDDIADKQLLLMVDLPARACFARADSARLQQVLWNLLKNGIKFTPPGGKITLRGSCDDQVVRVEVTDTGIGIDEACLGKVFHAFEQGHGTMHRFGGLGLGLSISRALAEAHGGTLEASSAGRDRGATFTLTVPAASPVRFVSPPDAAATPPPIPPRPESVRRILLVEDHPDTAMIMLRLLKAADFEVEWAATVQDALRAAEREKFDLLVSDLGLPDGCGTDLMRRLREQHGLKGIALSGYGMEEDVQKSREAGFAEHLTKPINMDALRSAIAAAVRE